VGTLSHILTLDLGTSACKATLFTHAGQVAAQAATEYETAHPAPGWAEQDPETWWQAAQAGVLRLPPDLRLRISAVGLSSHRGGVVPMDGHGRPLGPCIIWMDRRSTAEVQALVLAFGRERLHRITGLVPDTEFAASKLLWLRTHAPRVFEEARLYLQPRDYLYYRLTGTPATDYTLASRTMLLDLDRREWWREGCEFVGVTPQHFPPIYPSAAAPHRLSSAAAEALGLPSGTPVALGAGDRPCEVLGAGAAGGWIMVSTGTTTNVSAAIVGRPERVDHRVMCSLHAVEGMTVLEQGMAVSGAILRWFRDTLLGGRHDYATLDALASDVPPGADGLLFLPFMMGARATRWNPAARGVWFGLTEAHGTGALVRSIMEGVAYELRACLDVLGEMAVPVSGILAVGGGARSALWTRLFADVTEYPVRVPTQTDAASLGAMLLAAAATGTAGRIELAARSINPIAASITPDPGVARRYRELSARYTRLYEALRPTFDGLA
jgi:xylulokinase